MKSMLYAIALILVVIWSVAFYVYKVNGAIHVLIILAIIAVIISIVQGRKKNNKKI